MVFGGLIRYTGKAIINGYTLSLYHNCETKINEGDSIAINGVCLTVVNISNNNKILFNISEETLSITTLKYFTDETTVNIDFPLKYGGMLDGHVLSGHVYETGIVTDIISLENSTDIWIRVPSINSLKHKDSIAVDGISLTIAEIKNNKFRVAIIPYTLSHTNLSDIKTGDNVNIEYNNKEEKINYMDYALKLSEKSKNTAPPNPWVGCVIVKNNKIIGEGYHENPGQPHAEINAINSVINKDDIKDSDIYVTLEPCSHYGRTPPCVDTLIKYQAKKVIIGIVDPDIKVSGRGIEKLKENGIEVNTLISKTVEWSLRHYLYHRNTNRPFVTLKIALSLDGSMEDYNGESQWITGSESRKHTHLLRSEHTAIMVGTNTIINDNPSLTVRLDNTEIIQPLRIILDRTGKIEYDKNKNIFKTDNNVIFTSLDIDQYRQVTSNNISQMHTVGVVDNKLDLDEILEILGKINIISLFVEGGSCLHANFIENNLGNELYIYNSSHVLGQNSHRWSDSFKSRSIKDFKYLSIIETQILGEDVLRHYKINSFK